MKTILKIFIITYQKFISPLIPARCRYYPTCSLYCLQCLDELPIHLAIWYSIIRILKCNPLFSGGIDEVPKLKNK